MSGGLRKRVDRYVIVPREAVRTPTMSYRALGLLTVLLDAPEGFDVRSEVLAHGEGREGREAIRTALRELAAHGYYRLERRRMADGTCAMGTAVSNTPVPEWVEQSAEYGNRAVEVVEQDDGTYRVRRKDGTLTGDGFPGAGKPGAGSPGAGFLGASRRTVTDNCHGTTAPAVADAADDAEDEPDGEQQTLTLVGPEPDTDKRKAVRAPSAKRKGGAAPPDADERAARVSEAQALQRTFHGWWTKHRAPILNSDRAALAVRGMIVDALEAGYAYAECESALRRCGDKGVAWPSRPVWTQALTEARTKRRPQGDAPRNAHRSDIDPAERAAQREQFGG